LHDPGDSRGDSRYVSNQPILELDVLEHDFDERQPPPSAMTPKFERYPPGAFCTGVFSRDERAQKEAPPERALWSVTIT
jgi:hypothetical protein